MRVRFDSSAVFGDTQPQPPSDAVRFCPQCGTMLDLGIQAKCVSCGFACPVADIGLTGEEIVTTATLRSSSILKAVETELQRENRAICDEECPKCHYRKMYFSSAQLRSADEGETVFYECMRCGFRFTQNN